MSAQPSGDVVWTDAPLAEALYELSERSGLELVFALRLVEGTRVSGRWARGTSPDEALRRLLRGTGVRAERIRTGQYVLIREPINVTVGVEDGPEAYTATLEGRVVDASTGVPLWGAHVWLVDVGLGDVVDAAGGFAVPGLPTGEYAVRISHVGYEPVRVSLSVFPESARLPPTVRLAPLPVATGTAEVTAPPADPGPVPGTIDLAARQPAVLPLALAEADLAATLDWLPGLNRTGTGGGPVVIRGADPHRTRTLRDGVPVYGPWHAFGLVSTLHPETLSRVRLHRGAMPASLGGALAVLDTETTDAARDTTLAAGVSLLSARVLADVPVGARAGLHVAARRSTLGLALGPDERAEHGLRVARPIGGLAETPDLAFDDLEVKATARVGQTGRASLGGSVSRDRYTGGGAVHTWRGQTASARVRGLVGQRAAADVRLYASDHAAERALPGAPAPERRAMIAEAGLALDVDRFVSLEHDVEFGVSVARRRGAAAGADHTESVAYALDTWTPSDAWTVQPGLRLTRIAHDAGGRAFLSPRLYAERRAADGRFRVRAGVGRQVQPVQALVRRYGGRYDAALAGWALAGASLGHGDRVPVLGSWQSGAGVEWAPTEAVAFGVDGYVRRSEGLLEQDVTPAAADAGFAVHDERAAGLEAAARLDAGPWTVGLSGALARSEVQAAATPDRQAGPWRAARYDRALSGGVLAERRTERTTLAVRLDAESGLPRPDGSRTPASLRAGVAAGIGFSALGADWNALAQVELRARAPRAPFAGTPFADASLVADLDGLPALPLVSLSARW